MISFKEKLRFLSGSLNSLYRLLGLSKQAVHGWQKRQEVFNKRLSDLIPKVEVVRKLHPGCELEKLYYVLQPSFMGRDKFVNTFMDLGYGVVPPKNHIKTTIPAHCAYKNLIQGMLIREVGSVVQSDITYFLLHGKFYYLVFIIDVFSKRIVGAQVSDYMRATANLKALRQMIRLRGAGKLSGMIHHSDRGSQYVCKQYTNTLKQHACKISRSLSAQENAYAERVNGIIKNEYFNVWKISDFKALKRRFKQSVKHYNEQRIHNHLPPKMSPVTFETALKNKTLEQDHCELLFAKES